MDESIGFAEAIRMKYRIKAAVHRKYQKALETLVYVSNIENRSYWALKTIYFADRDHLKSYGRQLFGDTYIAMKWGPVPSLTYDVVKSVRGDGWYTFTDPDPGTAFEVPDKHTILPLRVPEVGLLSATDIECLERAHNLIKALTFDQLHELSRDEAYKSAKENDEISLENIILTLENGEEILEYIQATR